MLGHAAVGRIRRGDCINPEELCTTCLPSSIGKMASLSCNDLAPDDVVISGIGGSFPESENIEEFEKNLFNSVNMIHEINSTKWKQYHLDVPHLLGKLKNKNKFDSLFFGIASTHTIEMDPLTWKILENTYAAIVDSGQNPLEFSDRNTSVIMSINISEHVMVNMYNISNRSKYIVLGNCVCMVASRVSFWLNTKGTSYTVCAEEAAGANLIQIAMDLIKSGQCNDVIIGTVNFIYHPGISYSYKGLGRLSNNGECRAFDAEGSGYARSEACVVLYLQRAEYAKRVYATVVHAQNVFCGDRNGGLLRPVGDKLLKLLESFYEKTGVDPAQICYLESSANGIKEYEESEFEAVNKVLLRNRRHPLLIGSVKSNMGHGSSVALFCSVVKLLIAIARGMIPANLHYKTPGPHIPGLVEEKLKVVTEKTKWNPVMAAVNSLDCSGNFGHLLLRPYKKESVNYKTVNELPKLVCMSGRTEEGTKENLLKVKNMAANVEFIRLVHDVYSQDLTKNNYRGFMILSPTVEQMIVQHYDGSKRPVWFVFSGMGSQWPGMGKGLMKVPVTAEILKKCHRILQSKGVDLIKIITTDDPGIFDNILHSFVGISAIQIALVESLKILKIEPDGVIGHSVGELGCAYADGCFTMEQMILAAYYRGMASQEAELIEGRMAAIGLGYKEVKKLVPPSVDVACHNSATSSTVSGPSADVRQFISDMQSQNIFAKEVNVSNIAYHSRYIKPASFHLLNYLKKIIPEPLPRSSRWYCTSAPKEMWDSPEVMYSSAEYHTNNLLNPVLFEETCRHIPNNAILIEIAPRGLLQAILKRSMGPNCVNIPLCHHNKETSVEFFLSAIGMLYMVGLDVQVSALYPSVKFPVSRGTPSLSSLTSWEYSKTWETNVTSANKQDTTRYIKIDLKDEEFRALKGYIINGTNVLPISAILVVVWKALADIMAQHFTKLPAVFEELSVLYLLKLKQNQALDLTFTYQQATKKFELSEFGKEKLFVKGKLRTQEDMFEEFSVSPRNLENGEVLASNEIYAELESKGYDYGVHFRRLQKVTIGKRGSKALVDWSDNWIVCLESLFQLSALQSTKYSQNNFELPMFIRKVVIDPITEGLNHNANVREAQFSIFTNTVYCGSVELRGIKSKEVILEIVHDVKISHMEFYPYKKAHYQTHEEFISYAIQLSSENVLTYINNKTTLTVLVSDETTEILEKEIEDFAKKIEMHKVVIKKLSVAESGNISNSVLGTLLLASDSTVDHGIALLRCFDVFLLATIRDKSKLKMHEDMVIVDKQLFHNTEYLLIKKRAAIHDSDGVVFLPRFELLFSKTIFHEDRRSKLYIIAKSDSLDEVKAYVAELTENKKYNPQRFVFLLDMDAPPFSVSDKFYSEQLKLDLVMNIYYNGTWGSLKYVEIKNQPTTPPTTLASIPSMLRVKDVRWEYLGINFRNSKSTSKTGNQLDVLDVSGTAADGKKVMCLARLNTGSPQATTDPHFTWPVPGSWSLEDAATVPFAYCQAYYALVVKAAAKSGKTVLIHAGHTPVGQAFVAVALHKGLQVFTTICDKHNQFFRTKFPQIPVSNIFYLNDKQLAKKLLTNYRHSIHLVVNLLEEPFLQMSVNLLCMYGCILQLCTTEMELNKDLGMGAFLNAITLIAVIPEQLFEINPAWKIRLHELFEEGIRENVIQPMDREVILNENDIISSSQHLEFIHKVLVTKNTDCSQQSTVNFAQQMKCGSKTVFSFKDKTSCLIISDRPEDFLTMAEWLVSRGCCYLTICCNCSTFSYFTRIRLQLLRSRHSVHVGIVSVDKINSFADTVSLLHNINKTAPLSALFILPVIDMKFLNFLQMGLDATESTPFVLLMNCYCDLLTVTNMRRSGLIVVMLKIGTPIKGNKLWPLFTMLDKLLLNDCNDTVYVSVKENAIVKDLLPEILQPLTHVTASSSREQLSLLLPTSTEQLEDLGEDLMLTAACSLEEVCTKCPKSLYVREVLPVYIITVLQGPAKSCAQGLARNLMCPAFVVKIPGGADNIQENVAAIIKALRRVQSEGPYNLVGITWGGMYTIELAKQLQAEGEKTQVFLIDGAPQTYKDISKHLGEGEQLQVNLLKETLNITSDKVYAHLLELPTWDFRLQRALSELQDNTLTKKMHISFALESIYRKICNLLSYMPGRELLSGNVTLFRPKILSSDDTCGLEKFFKERANVVLIDADYTSLLKKTKLANIISDLSLVNLYWKKDEPC